MDTESTKLPYYYAAEVLTSKLVPDDVAWEMTKLVRDELKMRGYIEVA